MADAKQCDLCGNFYLENQDVREFRGDERNTFDGESLQPRVVVSFSKVDYNGNAHSVDYCNECKQRILKETGWTDGEK